MGKKHRKKPLKRLSLHLKLELREMTCLIRKLKKKKLKKVFCLKIYSTTLFSANSGGDFKRNIKNNAYKINNITETNEDKKLTLKDSLNNKIKISFGKKKHFVINII